MDPISLIESWLLKQVIIYRSHFLHNHYFRVAKIYISHHTRVIKGDSNEIIEMTISSIIASFIQDKVYDLGFSGHNSLNKYFVQLSITTDGIITDPTFEKIEMPP